MTHSRDEAQQRVLDAVASRTVADFTNVPDSGRQLSAEFLQQLISGAHGDEHDEHEGHGEEAHSEFHAHYHFECADGSKLTEIALPLFERFSGVQEIHLQAITPWGQFGGDIEPQDGKITLK